MMKERDNPMSDTGQTKYIIFNLSKADLRHEWILTLCLVMAIASVLAPLLLMFGLKYGIIKWGTDYLKNDPRYREIRPLASKTFEKEWFEEMRHRPDTGFVIPMTRQISATVIAKVQNKDKREEFNIIPTDTGDPLIIENGASVPAKGECVLTRFASESIGATIGDTIEISASRLRGTAYEYGIMNLKVSGILSLRASALNSVYVQLNILEAVEQFKDGQAVPEFGWGGSTPKAYPVYDSLIVVLPQQIDRIEQLSLANKTGFTQVDEIDNIWLKTNTGFKVSPEVSLYRLYTLKKPVEEESIKSVSDRLRGKNAVLIPQISPISAQLLDTSGKEIAQVLLHGFSADPEKSKDIGLSPVPSWGNINGNTSDMLKIMLPSGLTVPETQVSIKIQKEDESITFPVSVLSEPSGSDKIAFIPVELAGVLNLFRQRNLRYDESIREFVLFRRGYAGFRLYARSIDEVDVLRKYFETLPIVVHTEMLEIKKVKDLDKGMTLIFWLLAAVGMMGSVASLMASLYASVERKKREMSVLRLIGLSGLKLFRFPIYQGIFIGTGGFIVSMILFGIFSTLINQWFRPYIGKLLDFTLEESVRFCNLPLVYMALTLFTIVGIASLAAMVAAIRITRIEPAEALRDE
jgi:putative ABC transport system permease protein